MQNETSKAAPMIEDRPDHQGKLAPAPVEPFPNWVPPSDKVTEPVEPVEPVAETTAAPSAASEPDLSPQDRLNAARTIESELIGRTTSLKNAQRAARAAVALAVQEFQRCDSSSQSADSVARDFIRTSQEQKALRAERNPALQSGPAYIDIERKYSRGTDANSFARRNNRYGGSRGAFSKTALGTTNLDATRGAVPAPVETRPAIPALARK